MARRLRRRVAEIYWLRLRVMGTRLGVSAGLAWRMPLRPVWLVETTDSLSGERRTTYLPDEARARAYISQNAHPGTELLLRRGPGGPVVDLVTVPLGGRVRVTAGLSQHGTSAEARNKLEAVSRLGRINGAGPETLGPGSKERKSVLVNLGRALGVDLDERLSKPELGAHLARALGTTWDETCWSTGSTLTLVGLNRLLLAAEQRLAALPGALATSPEAEADSVLEVLARALPARFDGRECVAEMREAEFSQWAQDEWAGFYFEYVGLPALVNALGGGPVKYVNTRFDYCLSSAWDLKWHGADARRAPLNDTRAVDACLSERGLGFVVLSGNVEYDDGAFREWLKDHRAAHGKRPAARAHPAVHVRRSKRAFSPRLLEAFHIRDAEHLAEAVAAGALALLNQGRQVSGTARPPKYALDLPKARESLLIKRRALHSGNV